MPSAAGGASKCFRYTHTRSQAAGSQSCHDSEVTVCGNVTAASALSSNPGMLLSGPDPAPKSHPFPNGIPFTLPTFS
jgi:hypothetical protein